MDLRKIGSTRVVELRLRSPEKWEGSPKVPRRILHVQPVCHFYCRTSFLNPLLVRSSARRMPDGGRGHRVLVWNTWSPLFGEKKIFCLRFVAGRRLRNVILFPLF